MSDEKRLLEQAQRGEISAFRELVETYKRNVYYLALDLSGNHLDAEDISQEVFVRAFRWITKFRGEAKLSSWLYRITVNCFIDSKRKKHTMTISINEDSEENSQAARKASWRMSIRPHRKRPPRLPTSRRTSKRRWTVFHRASGRYSCCAIIMICL